MNGNLITTYNITPELIQSRYSCRNYNPVPLTPEHISLLQAFLQKNTYSPFNSKIRHQLVYKDINKNETMKQFGTYGRIRNPSAYIVSAVEISPCCLEDIGYNLEIAVLYATSLGIGTCWLGGTLTKNSFTKSLKLSDNELMPAVISCGYDRDMTATDKKQTKTKRKKNEEIFFENNFNSPLDTEKYPSFSQLLKMVQIAPSANNFQPWNIVKKNEKFHFYCLRSPKIATFYWKYLGIDDLQRLDIGIAMAHFEAAAIFNNIKGCWINNNPLIELPSKNYEYIATWVCE